MSDWQPIETAPKDGRFVLLCRRGGDYEYEVATRIIARNTGYATQVYVGAYVPFDDDPGDSVWLADGMYHSDGVFTHWMPLPEPPRG